MEKDLRNNAAEIQKESDGSNSIGRRSFLKGLAVSAVSVASIATLNGCSDNESQNSISTGDAGSFADSINWDGEYDVVVIGFGAAGASASMTAADEGASVLLLDKAPEEHVGGNSKLCGQMFVFGNEDVKATKAYYLAIHGSLPVDEEIVDVFCENVAFSVDNFANSFGLDKKDFGVCGEGGMAILKSMSPEFPEFPGSDKITLNALHDGFSDGYMWQQYRSAVDARSDKIEVWLESPGKSLIQDPQTKAVIGVEVEKNGATLMIRAKNGVVLTCGGHENNPEMIRDFLGIQYLSRAGTLYNTGDGVTMAVAAGADLWHMTSLEGGSGLGGCARFTTDNNISGMRLIMSSFGALASMPSSAIMVGAGGTRFMNETEDGRHGKIYKNGEWKTPELPAYTYIVFDQTDYDFLESNAPLIDEIKAELITGASVEDLANAIASTIDDPLTAVLRMPAENLRKTIESYSEAANSGHDVAFGREENTMRAFDDGPFYAIRVQLLIINTQGGARRNARGEVLDTFGNPIPHLYSAGEFGSMFGNQYQGGGNISECHIFGQISGRNAAAPKE